MNRARSPGKAFAILCAGFLAACSADRPRPAIEETLTAAAPVPVDSVALSPPAGMTASFPSEATSDWHPYRGGKRPGHWEGRSAWGHPPNRPASSETSAHASLARPGRTGSDRIWADRWVPPSDRDAFDAAVRAAASGGDGRWQASDGNFGVAAFAGRADGCAIIEVMLSSSQVGLPIRARGTVTDCASPAAPLY